MIEMKKGLFKIAAVALLLTACVGDNIAGDDLAGGSSDTFINPMTDSRDGKTYRTVKIGKQVWMAENLNYETEKSYCYNDSVEYCATYGRFYEWNAAMRACPEGWHWQCF